MDSSVWISHLKHSHKPLVDALEQNEVVTHAMIIGELALGSFKGRADFLRQMQRLPTLPAAQDQEVLAFIESQRLWGKAIGWTDAHLLAAAAIHQTKLLTLDKPLAQIAIRLGLA